MSRYSDGDFSDSPAMAQHKANIDHANSPEVKAERNKAELDQKRLLLDEDVFKVDDPFDPIKEIPEALGALGSGPLIGYENLLNVGFMAQNKASKAIAYIAGGEKAYRAVGKPSKSTVMVDTFRAEEAGDRMIQTVAQYLGPYAAIKAGVKAGAGAINLASKFGPKAAEFIGRVATDAITTATAYDVDDARLADLVQKNIPLLGPIAGLLAANPKDTEATKFGKALIEATIISTLGEKALPIAEALFAKLMHSRAAKVLSNKMADTRAMADDAAQRGIDIFAQVDEVTGEMSLKEPGKIKPKPGETSAGTKKPKLLEAPEGTKKTDAPEFDLPPEDAEKLQVSMKKERKKRNREEKKSGKYRAVFEEEDAQDLLKALADANGDFEQMIHNLGLSPGKEGGDQTVEQITKMAQRLGFADDAIEKLLARNPGEVTNAEGMIFQEIAVTHQESKILKAGSDYLKAKSPDELNALGAKWIHENNIGLELVKQHIGSGTATGRALKVHGLVNKNLSDAGFIRNVDLAIEFSGGHDTIRSMVLARAALKPDQAAKVMKEATGNPIADLMVGTWYGSVLSGIGTQTANAVTSPFRIAEDIATTAVSVARSKAGNTFTNVKNSIPGMTYRTPVNPVLQVQSQELYLSVMSIFDGGAFGLAAMKQHWKTGKSPFRSSKFPGVNNMENMGDKVVSYVKETSPKTSKMMELTGSEAFATRAIDILAQVSNLSLKGLGATDTMFTAMSAMMHVKPKAWRKAFEEGQMLQWTPDQVKKAYDDNIKFLSGDTTIDFPSGRANEINAVRVDALNEAKVSILTNSLDPQGNYKLVHDFINNSPANFPLWGTMIKPIKAMVPFYQIAANMADAGIRLSPLPAVLPKISKRFQDQVAKGGAAKQMAESRMIVGASISMYGMSKVFDGTCSGAGGARYNTQKASEGLTRIKPYHCTIAGKSFDMTKLGPAGKIMMITADLADISAHALDADSVEEFQDLAMQSLQAIGSVASPDYFINNIMALFTADGRGLAERLENVAAGLIEPLVPGSGARKDITRMIDPVKRITRLEEADRTNNVLNTLLLAGRKLMSRIPYLSSNLEPELNRLGDEVYWSTGQGPGSLSPLDGSPDSQVIREMNEVGLIGGVNEVAPITNITNLFPVGEVDGVVVKGAKGIILPDRLKNRLIRLSNGKGLDKDRLPTFNSKKLEVDPATGIIQITDLKRPLHKSPVEAILWEIKHQYPSAGIVHEKNIAAGASESAVRTSKKGRADIILYIFKKFLEPAQDQISELEEVKILKRASQSQALRDLQLD